MRDAVRHLNNFCAKLPALPYVSNMPLFNYNDEDSSGYQAIVRMPSSLDPALHEFESSKSWSTKKYAREDAALQAYRALFEARLVNDHLLPIQLSDILDYNILTQSHYTLPTQMDPWTDVAHLWRLDEQLYSHKLRIIRPDEDEVMLSMIMPVHVQTMIRIPLFMSPGTTYTALLTPGERITTDNISLFQQVTRLLLQSIYKNRWPPNKADFVYLFSPDKREDVTADFLGKYSGTTGLTETLLNEIPPTSLGLLRSTKTPCRPLMMKSWILDQSCISEGSKAILSAKGKMHPLTRRRNFLHEHKAVKMPKERETEFTRDESADLRTLVVQEFLVDKLPFVFAQTALLIPSIIHKVGVHLVAEKLRQLAGFGSTSNFCRLDLLATAVCAGNTERQDFRTMVFIGDTIIKFFVAKQLFLHHPLWHQGLLSQVKDAIISDAGLSRAVYLSDFGRFLITKRFNGKRWRPYFVSSVPPVSGEVGKRKVGAATLADMAKALVGASFLCEGMDLAATCASKVIHQIKSWNTTSLDDGTYWMSRTMNVVAPAAVEDLEKLLGHTFTDKSLLAEAMTHPSCTGNSRTTSYRRLSFLGNSVLDLIVVGYLQRHNASLSPERLQSLKSAVTHNMYLTFVCIDFHEKAEQSGVNHEDVHNIHIVSKQRRLSMWNYLRTHSQILSEKLSDFVVRSSEKVDAVNQALWKQAEYPWSTLTALGEMLPLSDIVQSTFGALYIDSKGSLTDCELLAQKMGILPLLQHLLVHNIVTDHPKTTLQLLCPGCKVSYRIYNSHERSETKRCDVLVDGSEIVMIEGQTSRGAIIVRAAEVAVRLMRKETPFSSY